MKVTALVLAAGDGTRMKSAVNKHLLPLLGQPLLLHTLRAFQDHPLTHSIVLVVAPNTIDDYHQLVKRPEFMKLLEIVPGGRTRQESCWLGLQKVEDSDLVAVHDGARPLVSEELITRTIHAAAAHGAALAAVRTKDTLKEVGTDGFVIGTPNRNKFWQAQTPQVFHLSLLRQAHEEALRDGYLGTDEASLVERMGHPVRIVEGDYSNLKVTTPEDLIIAERIMAQHRTNIQANIGERQGNQKDHINVSKSPMWLVGLGHDSHRFVGEKDNKPLVLGGIIVEGHRGLAGNSDADVILHAVFNALSQAIGEHSIGYYADSICAEEGITDSREYIKIVLQMVRERGYFVSNVGISIECRQPRIDSLVTMMKCSIADLLELSQQQVGITATSGEGLTSFGRGEGIQALAVVSLVHQSVLHS